MMGEVAKLIDNADGKLDEAAYERTAKALLDQKIITKQPEGAWTHGDHRQGDQVARRCCVNERGGRPPLFRGVGRRQLFPRSCRCAADIVARAQRRRAAAFLPVRMAEPARARACAATRGNR